LEGCRQLERRRLLKACKTEEGNTLRKFERTDIRASSMHRGESRVDKGWVRKDGSEEGGGYMWCIRLGRVGLGGRIKSGEMGGGELIAGKGPIDGEKARGLIRRDKVRRVVRRNE